MPLRCGRIFKNSSIAYLLVNTLVEEFRKLVSIWRSYGQKSSVMFLPRDAMLRAVYAVVVCLCVCLLVSHSGIVTRFKFWVPHPYLRNG